MEKGILIGIEKTVVIMVKGYDLYSPRIFHKSSLYNC